ncbi:hypothetical protein [Thermospira aquatica]|uniref:Uncharacterized protein n=1 Tax=Thermospira aquatica TaxID=2828656 RepID=A0AAX3BEJ7_9SPIR|nr:hypothetical protein [Thermospira aquatica]URA10684.1 hypothetical protein KDW03_02460 [Thermospira aquatica]
MKKVFTGLFFVISLGFASDLWYSQAYLAYLSLGYLCMLSTNGMYSPQEAVNRAREVKIIAQTSLKTLYQANDARGQALRLVYENLVFQANGLVSLLQTPSEEILQTYENLRQKTWNTLEMVKELP